MYAFLRGEIVEIGSPTVLDCQGVGYEVWIPRRDVFRLGTPGTVVQVFTHLQVREDDMTVYGFLRARDRDIFRSLIGVSGVGPKVALTLLGEESSERVLSAIAQGDAVPLTQVKGIGKKTAERLVVELKDTAAKWAEPSTAPAAAAVSPDDATLALVAMGLTVDRARAALARVDEDDRHQLSVEDLVRRALQHASL